MGVVLPGIVAVILIVSAFMNNMMLVPIGASIGAFFVVALKARTVRDLTPGAKVLSGTLSVGIFVGLTYLVFTSGSAVADSSSGDSTPGVPLPSGSGSSGGSSGGSSSSSAPSWEIVGTDNENDAPSFTDVTQVEYKWQEGYETEFKITYAETVWAEPQEWVRTGHATNDWLDSIVLDATSTATWDNIFWDVDFPVDVNTRSSEDNDTWKLWKSAENYGVPQSNPGRYYKYQIKTVPANEETDFTITLKYNQPPTTHRVWIDNGAGGDDNGWDYVLEGNVDNGNVSAILKTWNGSGWENSAATITESTTAITMSTDHIAFDNQRIWVSTHNISLNYLDNTEEWVL